MPSLIDLMLEGRQVQHHSPLATIRGRCLHLEFCSKRAGTGSLELARPLGGTLNGAYGDHG